MEASDVYGWLMGGGTRGACEAFDAHVIAGVLSLALSEAAGDDQTLVEAVGLGGGALVALVTETFPHAAPVFARILARELEPSISEGESCLRALLGSCTTLGTPLELGLAAMVARRAQRPHHLWQDLGLRHRRELSWLMARHFEVLAARNTSDMKWKKFLYRAICRDGSFPICPAPTCAECCDFEGCFGDEGGESLLARNLARNPGTGSEPPAMGSLEPSSSSPDANQRAGVG